MNVEDILSESGKYDIWLIIIGLGLLGVTILSRLLIKHPFSLPIALLTLGFIATALPIGITAPDLEKYSTLAEHLTELGVIISLMGAGLKIDRIPQFKTWGSTSRLLAITMVLTIIFTALAGWWLAAFIPATAVLFAAVVAPTDPVLASEVQVGAPGAGSTNAEVEETKGGSMEDEVRFSLTSEAGLNDGLAFPFVNMAIAMAIYGASTKNWIVDWLLVDVFYKLGIAVLVGIALGHLLARIMLNRRAETEVGKALFGLGALAGTLMIYGITQYIGGYGFIATFIGAVKIRNYERHHQFHKSMHVTIENFERLFITIILLALGSSIAGGLLEPLNLNLVFCALLVIFVIRPLSGILGFMGFKRIPWREKLAISFLGIRGIGSLYYLVYALNETDFNGADELMAVISLIVVLSIFIHGITATPITQKLDRLRQ